MYPERGDGYLAIDIEAACSHNMCGCESSNAEKTKKNETHNPYTVHRPGRDVVSKRETSRKTKKNERSQSEMSLRSLLPYHSWKLHN